MGADVSKAPYEFGYKPEYPPGQKYQVFVNLVREMDPAFHDPPVPVGQGSGPMGEPEYGRLRHPRQLDPNKPLEKQTKEFYFNDPNIKYIMEHWNISPEHPGMDFAPGWMGGSKTVYMRSADAGENLTMPGYGILRRIPPHYYSHPEGEACHEKAIAMAKFGVFSGLFYWAFTYGGGREYQDLTILQKAKFIPKACLMPISSTVAFATGTCVLCSMRKEDDWKNYAFGGACAALPFYGRYGMQSFCFLGFFFALAGSMFKIVQQSEFGFGDNTTSNIPGAINQLPNSWRWGLTGIFDKPLKRWRETNWPEAK